MVKSAAQGVSMGVGVRVISGERTGYAYSDDLSPEKIRKAALVAAHIAAGPSKVDKFSLAGRPAPQSVSGTYRPHRNGIHRARGTGETRRPGGPRLRFAHLPGAGHVRRQPAPRHGGHQRGAPHARPPAAGASQRLGPGTAKRRQSAARTCGRRRPRRARLLPQREDSRTLRRRSRARGHRHARRGGRPGRRNDRGARPGLARHPAARSRRPRPRSRFQPQGRLRLQRPHRPEGRERALHRDRRRHHRQPPRLAERR